MAKRMNAAGVRTSGSDCQFSKACIDAWVVQAGVNLTIESRNYRFRCASRDANACESGCLISRHGLRESRNIRECVTSSMRSRNEVANELSIRSMRLRA
jgi:hypothetical protein